MPRLEIKKDDQVLVVAERPEDISVENDPKITCSKYLNFVKKYLYKYS